MNLLKDKLTYWKKNSIDEYEKTLQLSDFLKLSSGLSILFNDQ
jgi:hypothetical protein